MIIRINSKTLTFFAIMTFIIVSMEFFGKVVGVPSAFSILSKLTRAGANATD